MRIFLSLREASNIHHPPSFQPPPWEGAIVYLGYYHNEFYWGQCPFINSKVQVTPRPSFPKK